MKKAKSQSVTLLQKPIIIIIVVKLKIAHKTRSLDFVLFVQLCDVMILYFIAINAKTDRQEVEKESEIESGSF